jgi:glutaminyl-peptide cyclotransferase
VKYVLNHFILFLSLISVFCSAQEPPQFDGKSAFSFLKKQCEFGPRNPGSRGHQQCKTWFVNTLKQYADEVTTQDFLFTFGTPAKSVTATNIIAKFLPKASSRVLLCAHWDTRPWADSDPDPKNHKTPIIGANDGASGVAVLLEIARLLKQQKPLVGVDIVLFDGEDSGQEGQSRSYAKGSAAFAQRFGFLYRYKWGILLDMIGDKDLTIFKENYSNQYAPFVVNMVWNKAAELGITEFRPMTGYAVFDDHVPLLEVGIPCIDLIDFNYPAWHTLKDTPEQCSAASLEKVGTVVTHVLYETR